MTKFFKYGGILDPVQPRLSPTVWTKNNTLKPYVKNYIMQRVKQLVGDQYTALYLIGSITSYQYTDDSDIDINVTVPASIVTPELQAVRKKTNGQLLPGTKHPVSLMLQPMEFTKQQAWQDSKFGVWNILENRWEVSPGKPEDTRDPADQFELELQTARMVLNHFKSYIKKWRKAQAALEGYKATHSGTSMLEAYELEKLQQHLTRTYDELRDFAYTVDKERKMEYAWGWGAPRANWRNILFKYLAHSAHGKIFEMLVEEKSELMKLPLAADDPNATFIEANL